MKTKSKPKKPTAVRRKKDPEMEALMAENGEAYDRLTAEERAKHFIELDELEKAEGSGQTPEETAEMARILQEMKAEGKRQAAKERELAQ